LFYDYPEDPRAYNDVLENAMLGDSIKISPNYHYTEEQYRMSIYFPGSSDDYWCPIQPDLIRQCFKGGAN
jgi:hypothetical protein